MLYRLPECERVCSGICNEQTFFIIIGRLLYLEAGFVIIHYKPPFLQSKIEPANQHRQATAASQWVKTEHAKILKEVSA